METHPFQNALYAVSVRQTEVLPPTSFRLRLTTDAEYDVIKRNIDSILRQDKEPEYNKEATRE